MQFRACSWACQLQATLLCDAVSLRAAAHDADLVAFLFFLFVVVLLPKCVRAWLARDIGLCLCWI